MLEVLGNGNSNGKSSSETRRATEDRLAVIFLVIILAFIFCHLPRVCNLQHNTYISKVVLRLGFVAWVITVRGKESATKPILKTTLYLKAENI